MTEAGQGLTAVGTFERLRDAFFRYYDTPFGLASEQLQRERRALLDRDGGVYRRPLIELRPEYRTTGRSLAESVQRAQAPPELAEFVAAGLIPPGRPLYTHQEKALELGLQHGRNVVLTAGTGSGKTESFLLPILATLLEESASWAGTPATGNSWWESDAPFASQRTGETGRDQAVRAIVLYPMNALVDDQLIRLRRALDSDEIRSWLDTHRGGHRFYFGRFTGATPVTGARTNGLAVDDLRKFLRGVGRRSARARQLGGDTQYFVPRLDGGEMRSRWDMLDAPPDILITNYSMLNVMLLRERDGRFFDSTAAWLRKSPQHRFTLVVDELHTYRGTAGTEVALLIRNLTNRLGLSDTSDQLRILAASASLDDQRDRLYLQDFFGVDQDSFEFLPGETVKPTPLAANVADAAQPLSDTSTAAAAILTTEGAGVPAALSSAFYLSDAGDECAVPEAKTEQQLADALFPGVDSRLATTALDKLLDAVAASEGRAGWPKLRSHLFFRNVPGIWACTDPGCNQVENPEEGRSVGRLYSEPATRCECGARVLELLYCQNCGDVMLGGFVPEGLTQRPRVKALLLADVPELARLPDQVRLDRTAANYLLYWPRTAMPEVESLDWSADSNNVTYSFRRSVLSPSSGELKNAAQGETFTGWSFHAHTAKNARTGEWIRDPLTVQPFPTVCPNCGDDWEIKYGEGGRPLPHTDPARQRSPIRGMRTGFEKINQVLVTELATQLTAEQRKLIVFTDSRQDAAKLSAGLDLRHYQDLLRILLYEHVASGGAGGDLAEARAWTTGDDRSADNYEAVKRLRARDGAAFARLCDLWNGVPDDYDGETAELEGRFSASMSLDEVASLLAEQLLTLGINPGGPHASLMQTPKQRQVASKKWSAAYDWSARLPRVRGGLSESQRALIGSADNSLRSEVIQGLFSGAGRDFESLGLGWLALVSDNQKLDVDQTTPMAIGRSGLRVLADTRRFNGLRDGRTKPHEKLRKYWEAVARHHGLTPQEVQSRALAFWGGAVVDYLIKPNQVQLRGAEQGAWVCGTCRRQHLHPGTGLCTRCWRPLPGEPQSVEHSEDYYAWKAVHGLGHFRLHCAELTGQTDREDAQSRQARFQNVFLDTAGEESPLADAVDLLSVTTTMEAGVDIGALEAVVLGNMPPTRFNYQQRVGRAGRRSSPVAVALTVCRGRSHDEYYFERPQLITNEPTPKPYLALGRQEIFTRALRSETLRLAFADLATNLLRTRVISDLTSNVHGQFGLAAEWPQVRTLIQAWFDTHRPALTAAADALTAFAPAELQDQDWAQWVQSEVVPAVDKIADQAAGHPELSQRLAEAGTLPMFGFPTRVRYLYLNRPTQAYPWPPRNVIDRDLAMAVSQFAPLSEVVRDGRVYPVVGITAFRGVRPRPQPEPDPLGQERFVAVCRACTYLAEQEKAAETPAPCPRCSAPPGIFQDIPLREPLGFRAARGGDFDGNFSWSARAMSAKAMTNLDVLRPVQRGDIRAFSGPGVRYVVNDNGGRLFRFRPASAANWGGFVSVDAIERDKIHSNEAVSGDELSVALGAVQPTDFLFIGPASPVLSQAGIRLNLTTAARQPGGATDSAEGRRAAWYSLAFLLRTVAATMLLDVQELELGAGIYTGLVDGAPATMAFLADTLENGAGFSTHLGTDDVFGKLLEAAVAYLEELHQPHHADECSASCYRCLRDYSNMAYHALLDWRLASDLLDVLSASKLEVDVDRERVMLAKWAEAYGADTLDGTAAPMAALRDHPLYGTCAVIARHPLEAAESTLIPPRLADATAEAEILVPGLERLVLVDTFVLDRDPGHVFELLQAADVR